MDAWGRTVRRAAWMTLAAVAMLVGVNSLVGFRTENPMRVPRLLQTDYPETVRVIRGRPRSVESSGCGATCVAAVGQYLTGNRSLGPAELFRWAVDNGHYFGEGLGHECLIELAALYELRAEWTHDPGRVLRSIRAGYPVVAHMGVGTFSSASGHYIVLIGETADGLILVHDPYRPERGDTPYAFNELSRQAKTGRPFMVIEERDGAKRLL